MGSLCTQPLFLRILYISGKILNILRFVVPIVLIIRVGIEIYGRIMNPDNKDGLNKIKTRTIAAIIVFLIPTIISIIYEFIEKNIVNNEYSDMTVCREFANIEYIKSLEDKREDIENTMANDERVRNLNAHDKYLEAVRIVSNKNYENNSNSDSNSDNNPDNNETVTDITNASGILQAKKYNNWNYYLFTPNSAKNSSKPLVIFLHGSGERGSNISLLENYGFAKYIKKGTGYDAYVLMPQLPSGSWDTGKLMSLIKQVVKENNVDQSRISISGFSLGTVPIPTLVSENPRYFSAVVFIGLCTDADSKASSFRNTPTRLYHGGSDHSCKPSHSKSFAEVLRKNNGNVNLFILEGKPHNVVDTVLKDGKVISWMASQRR